MPVVLVKHIEQYSVMDQDGQFRCAHANIYVTAPCCFLRGSSGTIECGCQGRFSIYCPDCQNKDMMEDDEIIIKETDGCDD